MWVEGCCTNYNMPAAFFQPVEHDFLPDYVEQWRGLKGVGKEHDEAGNMISAKDRLIDEMVASLLENFPE
jgi:hypothetical protein